MNTHEPISSLLKRREIPSLNGIRAIAALTVVLAHLKMRGELVLHTAMGPYAVICFFVLSGFLITNLLLQERSRTGATSLKKFYARRTLRIFPAFWVLCGVFLVLSAMAHKLIHWDAWLACVFYVSNYFMAFHAFAGATLNHSWSLAIEEQFYLLWPAVFRRFAANRRQLIRILTGVIVFVWIYRALMLYWLRVDWMYVYCAFETRADALAIGCLMAVLASKDQIPRWLCESKWPGLIAALAILGVAFAEVGDGADYYVFPAAFAVLILQAVIHHRSPVYRWLNWGPMSLVGTWSYSIYLYHIFAHRFVPDSIGFAKLPLQFALAVLLGAGSYYLVERPVLSLRDKWFGSERKVAQAGRAARAEAVAASAQVETP